MLLYGTTRIFPFGGPALDVGDGVQAWFSVRLLDLIFVLMFRLVASDSTVMLYG